MTTTSLGARAYAAAQQGDAPTLEVGGGAVTTGAAVSAPGDALLGVYRRAPMEFVRGAGVELFDADGKPYLDFVAGIAVNALGYGDTGLEQAMRDAMTGGVLHVSNLYRTAPGER